MRWSYKCGKLLGIDLYIHIFFFILLGWILVSKFMYSHSWFIAMVCVALLLIVFAIVVMHELGHAMAARKLGIPTRDIVLLPIGGMARLERMPEKPKEELFVSLAGPAVNLFLALALGGVRYLHSGISFYLGWGNPELDLLDFFLHWLIMTNVGLLLFNLIPAFPMDGGRVLRALLGFKYDYLKASEIAVKVGKIMAIALFVSGLWGYGSKMLMVIAIFVWRGGSSELNMIRQREMLRNMARQYGIQGDYRQGFDLPNGERITVIPSDLGWRVVRVVQNMAENTARGANIDRENIYRNIAKAHRAEDRDDEPRTRVIDVQ